MIGETGKSLGKLQNVTGSLLEKVGRVVGVPKLNITDVRKAAEAIIQRDERMKRKSTILNSHSQRVGETVYDQTTEQVRGEYVVSMEFKENEKKKKEKESPIDEEREKRKKKKELEDAKISKEHADKYLLSLKERSQKNRGYSKRCKVKQIHKLFLMEIVFKEIFKSKVEVFPRGEIILITVICMLNYNVFR